MSATIGMQLENILEGVERPVFVNEKQPQQLYPIIWALLRNSRPKDAIEQYKATYAPMLSSASVGRISLLGNDVLFSACQSDCVRVVCVSRRFSVCVCVCGFHMRVRLRP